ncbi:MAG: hypothetical protein JW982_07605 [Spirochaetes bacterium]|nr:hypothetical protein [Spirochaetota bacterium]
MNAMLEKKAETLNKCKELIVDIYNSLDSEEVAEQLDAVERLEELSVMMGDNSIKDLAEYKHVREVLKKLHIKTAKTLMSILESSASFSNDERHSFNYSEPKEQIQAAEDIKLLPNAFIGGPMKSAMNSKNPKVLRVAIDHYKSLPSSVRVSDVFPPNFGNIVRTIDSKLK